jgi:hypothetical protein
MLTVSIFAKPQKKHSQKFGNKREKELSLQSFRRKKGGVGREGVSGVKAGGKPCRSGL